jgi:ATP-binding protein involved in chromosome partitioning
MSIRRAREALRKGRAENALKKALAREGIEAELQLRALDDRLSAVVIIGGRSEPADEEALRGRLTEASGIERIVIVRSDHGQSPPQGDKPKAPPPSPPPRAGGGHSDPLHLGSRPAQRSAPARPEGVKAVIAVASGKGGVGKSTVAARLALSLRAKGLDVGLLDLDIHGPSLPVLFPNAEKLTAEEGRIRPSEAEGLRLVSIGYMVDERKAVAWRGPMVMNAARQLIEDTAWGDLDVLVVDTPPGTGDAHLSLLQRLKVDGAVLVATPSPLALADVRRGAALFRQVGAPSFGVVLNMTGGAMGDDLPPELLEELGLGILARLPVDPDLARAPLTLARDAGVLAGLADEVLKELGHIEGDSAHRTA